MRQSFSHGRTKQVVVEKVKRRVIGGRPTRKPEARAGRARAASAPRRQDGRSRDAAAGSAGRCAGAKHPASCCAP